MKPLLEIAGGPGQRWGIWIDEGFVVFVEAVPQEVTDEAGKVIGKGKVWKPMNRVPAKLLEHVPTFIAQHEPWLRPIGMPVSQSEYARIAHETRNRVIKGGTKPALAVVDEAEQQGAADAAAAVKVEEPPALPAETAPAAE